MRAAALAPLLLGACLEVPSATCPTGNDFDRDGWPCDGVRPDCDDGNDDVHPGAYDDCATIVVEDCGGEPIECPVDDGLRADTEPGAATWSVHGGGISATFVEGLQWVFASLRAETPTEMVELLSTDPNQDEQYVGVNLYPPWDQWEVTSATPSVLDAGPAYVRIQVEYSNVGTDEAGLGSSTFGFFPDATIHRHEVFDTPGSSLAFAFLSAHWSLDATRFSRLSTSLVGDIPIPDPGGGALALHTFNTGVDAGVLCAYDLAARRRVTMAWRDATGAAGSRVVVGPESGAPPRLALNYDWRRSAMIQPAIYESVTALAIDAPDESGAPCASAGNLAGRLRTPAALEIEAGLPGPNAGDDGYVVTEGVYEVEVAPGDPFVELTTADAMPRGLMLRVVIAAPGGVSVWRGGELRRAGRDYQIQPSDDGVTVFFAGPIARDETVRIAAPGGEPI